MLFAWASPQNVGATYDVHGPFGRGKVHGDVLVPDLAGWRRERMPELPDAAAFELSLLFWKPTLQPTTRSVNGSRRCGVPTPAGASTAVPCVAIAVLNVPEPSRAYPG